VYAFVAIAAVGWALRWWCFPWPTPARSLMLIAAADLGITVACLQDSDRLAGLTGTTLFVVTGAYLTFFHGPKPHAYHVLWAVVTILVLAALLGIDRGPSGFALAAAKALLALTVIVGILPILQFGYWLVRSSSIDSLTDPLTRLANRRGLDHHFARLADKGAGSPLCAVVVDLDDFKAVNDRHGHLVGDKVLVRTAERIRECVRSTAFVARLGGEEFLVLDHMDPDIASMMAEDIRCTIAAPADPPITASVGVATTAHPLLRSGGLSTLLAAADAAMYAAKEVGGNTLTVHA